MFPKILILFGAVCLAVSQPVWARKYELHLSAFHQKLEGDLPIVRVNKETWNLENYFDHSVFQIVPMIYGKKGDEPEETAILQLTRDNEEIHRMTIAPFHYSSVRNAFYGVAPEQIVEGVYQFKLLMKTDSKERQVAKATAFFLTFTDTHVAQLPKNKRLIILTGSESPVQGKSKVILDIKGKCMLVEFDIDEEDQEFVLTGTRLAIPLMQYCKHRVSCRRSAYIKFSLRFGKLEKNPYCVPSSR